MGAEWTEQAAVHLLSRAAFFAGKQDVSACMELGKEETVRRLIAGQSLTGAAYEHPPIEQVKADGKELKPDSITDQQSYWLQRMVMTEAPLIEKMTLFWHGHFATSYQKVKEIPLMIRQNELFRSHALGSFRDLLVAVGKDPAMMLYLDSNNNKKGKPNENYAREVMELFSLGLGNYTEQDIKEAARAFTGWTYSKQTEELKFNPKNHDNGKKTILGHTGNFNETSVIDVFYEQEALPRFMAAKLLKFFAVNEPSPEWITEVADDFIHSANVGEVLSKLFLSDTFYDPAVQGSLIKSPVEYVVGMLKALRIPMSKGFAQATRKMGQELYLPPDVAGWRGGTTWLMTTCLLARYQFAESVAKRVNIAQFSGKDYIMEEGESADNGVGPFAQNVGVWSLSDRTRQVLAQYAEETFVHSKQKMTGMKGLLHLIMISPEAQMK
ncbi:DUF1800 domain-containing protein [Paenibacillus sp. H1-7]|uniref:DUF1800 domain-containing protein n=1 Tax=Paenibacillus sp. H1-7 TaxID=2282849 RepID=UPI001EF8E899|nr:DUF1800 domain-containing protein [Paenibacillus sp. H1-7]ULL14221.1 DUF1800 domain-containing protein [Paenibacillus sp. H1-7]